MKTIIRTIFFIALMLLYFFIGSKFVGVTNKDQPKINRDAEKRGRLESLVNTYLLKNNQFVEGCNIMLTLKKYYNLEKDDVFIKDNGEEFSITVTGMSNITIE